MDVGKAFETSGMVMIEAASKQIDAGMASLSQSSLRMVLSCRCAHLSWHRRRLIRIPRLE